MNKRIFNLAAGVCVLLWLAVVGVWFVSPVDLVRSTHAGHWVYLGVYLNRAVCDVAAVEPLVGDRMGTSREVQFAGVSIRRTDGATHLNASWSFSLPMAYLAALLAVMPLIWMWLATKRWRHAALVRAGHCATCGYDLRATPGRCPECGSEAANSAPARGSVDRRIR